MGSAAQKPLTGTQVASLPAPEPAALQPWPFYDIPPATRKSVIAGQWVPTLTLGSVAKSVVVAQPVQPRFVPKDAKRVAGQMPAGSTAAPIPAAVPPTRPLTSPGMSAQAQAPVRLPSPHPPTQPIRTAGPARMPRTSPRPVTPLAAPGPQVPVASPAPAGSGGTRAQPAARAAKGAAMPQQVPQPLAKRTSGLDIDRLSWVALVLGLLSLVAAFFTSIPAIVCGHLTLRRADPIWTPLTIRRRAQWALGLGYTATLAWLVVVILLVGR